MTSPAPGSLQRWMASVAVVFRAKADFYIHPGAAGLLHANPTQKWGRVVKEQQEVCEPVAYFYTHTRCAWDWARLLFWWGQCLELPFMLLRLREKEEERCSWRGRLLQNAGVASSRDVQKRVETQNRAKGPGCTKKKKH